MFVDGGERVADGRGSKRRDPEHAEDLDAPVQREAAPKSGAPVVPPRAPGGSAHLVAIRLVADRGRVDRRVGEQTPRVRTEVPDQPAEPWSEEPRIDDMSPSVKKLSPGVKTVRDRFGG